MSPATAFGFPGVQQLRALLPSMERQGNLVRDVWDRLSPIPGGKRAFGFLLGQLAPYTGSARLHVVELSAGYAKVRLPDRRAVRNHLRSIHAIALLNLAEAAANLALAYGLPDDARFIISGISIDYLKKARGDILAECRAPVPSSNERVELELRVSMRNAAGEEVATSTVRSLVGPKRAGHP